MHLLETEILLSKILVVPNYYLPGNTASIYHMAIPYSKASNSIMKIHLSMENWSSTMGNTWRIMWQCDLPGNTASIYHMAMPYSRASNSIMKMHLSMENWSSTMGDTLMTYHVTIVTYRGIPPLYTTWRCRTVEHQTASWRCTWAWRTGRPRWEIRWWRIMWQLWLTGEYRLYIPHGDAVQ